MLTKIIQHRATKMQDQEQSIIYSSLYGFTIPSPPEIESRGSFVPELPPKRVRTINRMVSTKASWNHKTSILRDPNWGWHWFNNTLLDTLDLQWVTISEMDSEAQPQERKVTFETGIVTSDSDTQAFTASVGAEAKGLSASLSETYTHEHSISISKKHTEERVFHCNAETTVQVWQLVAIFQHTEFFAPFNTGYSIDLFEPPIHPGLTKLTVHSDRTISRTFPR